MKDLFHIHTYRCGHASADPDEAYIKKAIELGADRITFTDHAPFPGDPFTGRMKFSQLLEYIASLQDLKAKYTGKIEVRIGLEIEYLPSFKTYYEELKGSGNYDILMIGQHHYEITPGKYSFELPAETLRNEEYMHESLAVIEAMKTGLFDVVAHPDRIFRKRRSWDSNMAIIAADMLEAAHATDTVLELNKASMQGRYLYWPEFWSLARNDNSSHGIIRTIAGYDAHSVDELCARYHFASFLFEDPFENTKCV